MSTFSSSVTETQIGAIAESLVATQLIVESKGRLSPFTPLADDRGIDLLLYDKGTGHGLPLQIKSRTKTLKRNKKTVHFEVRKATFMEQQDACLLGALLDTDGSPWTVRRAWLIPMRELAGVASDRTEKLVIRPSLDMKSRDRYSSYRCRDMAEVAERLIAMFESRLD
jgi:hypothetical protein